MANNISPAGAALGFSPLGFGRTGVAAVDGGLGSLLQKQVGDETEDEKLRKRLGLSATQSGSPALQSLLGGMGNIRY